MSSNFDLTTQPILLIILRIDQLHIHHFGKYEVDFLFFMITAILPAFAATALFLSSAVPGNIQSPATPNLASAATSASSPAVPLTRVLPENNVVGHTVVAGEDLGTIAQDEYGDSAYWTTIWDDNPWVADPDAPEAGTLLTIRINKPDKPGELTQELQTKDDALVEKKNEAYLASINYPGSQPQAVVPEITPEVQPTVVQAATSAPAASQGSYDSVYQQAGARFGVPWQILYGIHMTETGGRNGAIFNGAGSGAQGPMQFMPGTFNAYAVDGDGDGVADINNATDAIYTAANFLAKHGSISAGLASYGGNTSGTLAYAREKGYNQ